MQFQIWNHFFQIKNFRFESKIEIGDISFGKFKIDNFWIWKPIFKLVELPIFRCAISNMKPFFLNSKF